LLEYPDKSITELMGSSTILIVDDDEGVQQSLANLLRDEGYQVETVNDGRAALHRLEAGPRPSVILLDLMMPLMDGIEFRSRQLSDSRIANIPIIVMSASPTARRTAERLAAADCLPKPMSFDDLIRAVQNSAITVVTTEGLPHKPRSLREAWRALRRGE
jgi:CheY-like chemotaxis protein